MQSETIGIRAARRPARAPGWGWIVLLVSLGACSTLDTRHRMTPQPEDDAWRSVDVGMDAPFAGFVDETSGLEVRIGVPLSGAHRISYGPCLLPVLPGSREWPQPLKVYAVFQRAEGATYSEGGPLQLRFAPGDWSAEIRSKEFGVTFGAEETRARMQPAEAIVQEYQAAWVWPESSFEPSSRIDASPVAGDSVAPVLATIPAKGSVLVELTFGVYDNQFLDFRLAPLDLRVNGRLIQTPSLQFERESDLDYTPFTMKILDL